MDLYSEEFIYFFRTINLYEVKYILVGGFATNYHGYHRVTGDLDLWIEDSSSNREKLISVFNDMGFGRLESLRTAILLPGYCEVMLDSGMYIDLMDRITAFDQEKFQLCFDKAEIHIFDDIPIRFLHYNHLLESKKNSSRLKDKLDVQELEKLKRSK